MKKIITLFTLILMTMSLFAFTVNTSRGEIELGIPDGYTLEEAYCEMARLYLEERWDHETLIESSKGLTEEVDKYVLENKKLREDYEALNISYTELIDLYSKKTRVKFLQPFMGGNVGTNSEMTSFSFGLDVGVIVLDNYILYTSMNYPLQLKVGIDIKL